MKTLQVGAVALITVAIGICLHFGTIGWFSVGFGVMTDCTSNYTGGLAGSSPCTTTERWINVGGLAQLLLAGAGVVVLIRVLIFFGTTWLAENSYCQRGAPGVSRQLLL